MDKLKLLFIKSNSKSRYKYASIFIIKPGDLFWINNDKVVKVQINL